MSELSAALLGLTGAGKTVIFNLITGRVSDTDTHPRPTIKPVRRIVTVQDERMGQIAAIIQPAQLFPLQIEVIDMPGIFEGAADDNSGGQEALNALREADVLAYVVRAVPSADRTDFSSTPDLVRDVQLVDTELIRADLAAIKRESQKIERLSQVVRQARQGELALLNEAIAVLSAGRPLGAEAWSSDATILFKQLNLITHRPRFYIINYEEDDIDRLSDLMKVETVEPFRGTVVGSICAQLEYEICQLGEGEQQEMLSLYPSLQFVGTLIPWWILKACNIVTYFTFGHLGLKEWGVPAGADAVLAAKRLHTDIAKGLIAIEVFNTADLVSCGSVEEVKREGKLRVEGRDYQIQDGDILYFRFSK